MVGCGCVVIDPKAVSYHSVTSIDLKYGRGINMAKLPIKIAALIQQVNDEQIPHQCSIIRRHKAGDESLPRWYTDKPVEYYEGLLDSCYAMIEQILHAYNAYAGFGFSNEWDDDTQRNYHIR